MDNFQGTRESFISAFFTTSLSGCCSKPVVPCCLLLSLWVLVCVCMCVWVWVRLCVCVCAFVRVRGTEEVRERDLQSSSLRPLPLFLFLSLVSSETLTLVPPSSAASPFSTSLVSSACFYLQQQLLSSASKPRKTNLRKKRYIRNQVDL